MQLILAEALGDEPLPVDACSGNFVCFPRKVVDQIGFPNGKTMPHAFGDLDYTLRAQHAGFPILANPQARATAAPNNWKNHASWLLSDLPVTEIWRGLWQKRSYAYAPAHVRFLARHFGLAGALYWMWTILKRIPISLLRLTVPQKRLQQFWGRRSAAWREEQRHRSPADDGPRPPVK
jgi:GT2 family glycosyltransferase